MGNSILIKIKKTTVIAIDSFGMGLNKLYIFNYLP